MSEEILTAHRDTWKSKPVLRELYSGWYELMVSRMVPGVSLEVGGGSGNLKEYAPDVVCTDIVSVPWLDVVADAQALPFRDASFDNLVLFDVLHHIENPVLFLRAAERVLRPGGRLVMMEPYMSVASWPVYHFLHPEPVDFRQDPLEVRPPEAGRKPFDANQAMSNLMFARHYARFRQDFPGLRLAEKKYLSFIVYPLSGGFDHPSLVPAAAVGPLLRFERLLEPLGRLLAFRVLLTLERVQPDWEAVSG